MTYFLQLTLLGFLVASLVQAQSQTTYATKDTAYVRAVEQALSELKKSNCQACLDAYRKAFAISQKSALSTMRAALCAYQCNQEELTKAYIQRAIDIDYEIAEDTWTDRQMAPEFDVVRPSTMNQYIQEAFARRDVQLGLNQPLKQQLTAIYTSDQHLRSQLDSLSRLYGQRSPQMQQTWQQIHTIDSVNLGKIERIIQQYGYPGRRLVGAKQSNTAWLVIQHSPLAIQEKYLPVIQRAAEQKEMSRSNLALLVDRIRMYKGQKQLYGSQVSINADGKKTFHPIEDEVNVNKRRAEFDLEPIEEYARHFGFEYVPPKK